MKIELNYDYKTITVKDQINLKEVIKEVKKLGLDLSEWSVISEIIWNTSLRYPIITYPQPNYPFWEVYCGTGQINLRGNCDTVCNIQAGGISDGTTTYANYPSTLTDC
jgi:hypothetical protein